MASGLVHQFAHVLRGGHAVDVTGEVARLTGTTPRPLDRFLHDHAAAFQS